MFILTKFSTLTKKCEIEDIIREELRAIYVPWDVTPKQFAGYLNEALKMKSEKYLEDIQHNFKLAQILFDPVINMKRVIDNSMSTKRLKRLSCGENSDVVITQSEKIMTEFFGCDVPIEWS